MQDICTVDFLQFFPSLIGKSAQQPRSIFKTQVYKEESNIRKGKCLDGSNVKQWMEMHAGIDRRPFAM